MLIWVNVPPTEMSAIIVVVFVFSAPNIRSGTKLMLSRYLLDEWVDRWIDGWVDRWISG
jgi:hypothetical protein